MSNKEIRDTIFRNRLKYWQLADEIGISASSLAVWLRHELTGERLERVTAALEKLLDKGGGNV